VTTSATRSACGIAVVATLLAALAFAAPASAGTLTVDGTAMTMSYAAAPGEANQVVIGPYAGDIRVEDRGVSEIPLSEVGGSSCVIQEPWRIRCPAKHVATAKVDLGDGPRAGRR
jgi:hypothetical protein